MADTPKKSKVVHLRIPVAVLDRIAKIAIKEGRSMTNVMQMAVKQICDQGFTDTIVKPGRI